MNKLLIIALLGSLLLVSVAYLVLSRRATQRLPVEKKPAIEEVTQEMPTEEVVGEALTPEEYMEQLLSNMTETEFVDYLVG